MNGIDTDDLYGLPLDRFVPERDGLARAMRAEGRREEAAAVAKLPKPSVAAWVVNQLVRSHRPALKAVLAAGDALQATQTAVIDGHGDGQSLRAAAEQERAAVDELLGAAQAVTGADGPALSATILDRVADTLHAAAFDEDARVMVQAGRLKRELRHVGLGGVLAGTGPPPATRRAAPKTKPGAEAAGRAKADAKPKPKPAETKAATAAETKAAKAKAATEARQAAKQAQARAEAHRAAKQAEAQARRRADRAERALARTQERRDRAGQALEEADEALADARAESDAAAEAHRQAVEQVSSNQ